MIVLVLFFAGVGVMMKQVGQVYCAYLVWPCLEVNPHDKA